MTLSLISAVTILVFLCFTGPEGPIRTNRISGGAVNGETSGGYASREGKLRLAVPSASRDQGNRLEGERTMKFHWLVTDAENPSRSIHSSSIAEERSQNGPSVAEIRRRALEIHINHGGHSRDLEDYLDDWLQAERELREKYNKSNHEGAKEK